MTWWINVLIGVLIVVLGILIVVRIRLKRKLESIDGMVGITRRSEDSGRIIGGQFVKVYRHKRPDDSK